MGFFDKIFGSGIDSSKRIDTKSRREKDELDELSEKIEAMGIDESGSTDVPKSEEEPPSEPGEEKVEISDEELLAGAEKRSLFSFLKKKKRPKWDRTSEDINKDVRSKVGRLSAKLIFFGIVIMMLIAGFITARMELRKSPEHTKDAEALKEKEDVNLFVGDEKLWKLQTTSRVMNLEKKVEGAAKRQVEEFNATKHEIFSYLDKKDKKINEMFSQIASDIKKETGRISQQSEEKFRNLRRYTDRLRSELEQKVNQPSPTISKEQAFLPIPQMKPVDKNTQTPPENNGSAAEPAVPSQATASKSEEENEKERALAVEESLKESEVFNIDTDTGVKYTEIFDKYSKEKNETLPPLHVMTGFAKATLITGVSAPTFGKGVKNPKPVLMTIDSKNIIANDEYEQLEDCMLIGTATGNLNTARAEIMVTRLSCSALTKDGHRVKIEHQGNPLGWVIDESGTYGVKGRLVDSAGKLVMRQLVVGFLQGVSMAFSTPQVGYLGNSGGYVNPFSQQNVEQSLSTGASQGVGSALNSLADYYTKMLDGTYPYVSVRAGRRLTVLFQGFDDVAVDKYRAIDVDNGEDGMAMSDDASGDSIDVEVDIDYDDF